MDDPRKIWIAENFFFACIILTCVSTYCTRLFITLVFVHRFLDYVKGFGGKFGVETDRKDKSALGWDEHEKLPQHESQIGMDLKLVDEFLHFMDSEVG